MQAILRAIKIVLAYYGQKISWPASRFIIPRMIGASKDFCEPDGAQGQIFRATDDANIHVGLLHHRLLCVQ